MREITVQRLLDEGADSLKLKVLAGEAYLNRKVQETAMNRPGLALTGFYVFCVSAIADFWISGINLFKKFEAGGASLEIRSCF